MGAQRHGPTGGGHPDRAFILDATHRVEEGRTLLVLWARLESGASALIRDHRVEPGFWVRTADVSSLPTSVPTAVTEERSLRGDPVTRVVAATPSELRARAQQCEDLGVDTFEADVRTAIAELVKRGIKATFEIDGPWEPGERVDRVYENPRLAPTEFVPQLRVLSFDIETDPRANELLSIAVTDGERSSVFLRCDGGRECPPGAIAVEDERELLLRFEIAMREFDPDVITGWNIIEFDLPVLRRVADRLRMPLELGRDHGALRFSRQGQHIGIPGRVVLDGIRLLRGAFVRMESYALDAVAREVLGQGKTVSGKHRADEILRLFEQDRARFVEYNQRDAELVLEILAELRLIDLTIERSRLTGMTPDRVTSSTGAFDYLYLSELRRKSLVAPTVGQHSPGEDPVHGAHVFEPVPGLHRNVFVCDFKSLYPSIIRTFQIDPVGWIPDPRPEEDVEHREAIIAPNGAYFRREPGILTGILDELFPRREQAKMARNKVADQAIKILMNSLYGVLGTPACRFHSTALSNAITAFGRQLLKWSRDRCEEWGHAVLYGDTDSLFVATSSDDPDEAWTEARAIVDRLNAAVAEHVRAEWQVESRLEMELEKLYLRLHLQHMRQRSEGARKRYVGLVRTEDGSRVEFTGVEAVRRDWTEVARELQREIYERLFADRPVVEYLRRIVAEVRAGDRDRQLIYRKALRKRPEEYTRTTPPHVAAARKLSGKVPRLIEYVLTTHGPEPIVDGALPSARLDYDHYLQKQVRPIAEPVLELLGYDFAAIVGGGQQLELF